MVRYGGVVGDHEIDDVERKAIIAAPWLQNEHLMLSIDFFVIFVHSSNMRCWFRL
jgi:hypothetical protein